MVRVWHLTDTYKLEVSSYLQSKSIDIKRYNYTLISNNEKTQLLKFYELPPNVFREINRDIYKIIMVSPLKKSFSSSFYVILKKSTEKKDRVVGNFGLRTKNGFIKDLTDYVKKIKK